MPILKNYQYNKEIHDENINDYIGMPIINAILNNQQIWGGILHSLDDTTYAIRIQHPIPIKAFGVEYTVKELIKKKWYKYGNISTIDRGRLRTMTKEELNRYGKFVLAKNFLK